MYMTFLAGSPCAKMVSFPRNLSTFLPRPAESRNDCTLKAGVLAFALGGERRTLTRTRRGLADIIRQNSMKPDCADYSIVNRRGAEARFWGKRKKAVEGEWNRAPPLGLGSFASRWRCSQDFQLSFGNLVDRFGGLGVFLRDILGLGGQKVERRLEVRFRCQGLGARCGGRPHKGTRVRKQERLWLGVGAALESGAIVVGAGWVVAGGLLLGLLGFRAQRWFAGGVIRYLAREHDVAQAGLHGIEFGGGDDVFLPRREDAGDFLLRILDALGRRGMR